jgi:hypothetical protein
VAVRRFAHDERIALVLGGESGAPLALRGLDLAAARLVRAGPEAWGIALQYTETLAPHSRWGGILGVVSQTVLRGRGAMVALEKLFPHLERRGVGGAVLRDATQLLERTVGERWSPGAAVDQLVSTQVGVGIRVDRLPRAVQLAVEMALHEEQERRFAEGELAGLAAAWRAAEEIASIADELLTPPEVEVALRRLARQNPADGAPSGSTPTG